MSFVAKDKGSGKYVGKINRKFCIVNSLEQAEKFKNEKACSNTINGGLPKLMRNYNWVALDESTINETNSKKNKKSKDIEDDTKDTDNTCTNESDSMKQENKTAEDTTCIGDYVLTLDNQYVTFIGFCMFTTDCIQYAYCIKDLKGIRAVVDELKVPLLNILPVNGVNFKKPNEDMCKPVTTAKGKIIELSLLKFYIEDRLQTCSKEISRRDLEKVDFYHAMELYDLNVVDGFYLYKAFQNMLRERRRYKNEYRELLAMKELLKDLVRAPSILGTLGSIENQKYTPRALPNLFKESDINA